MKNNKQKTQHGTPVQGTVAKIFNKQAEVLVNGETVACTLPSTLMLQKNAVVVGDMAEILPAQRGKCQLTSVLPRRSALCRGNRRTPGESLMIAANADLVLVVAAADSLLHQTGYLESAMLAAARAGLGVCLYATKCDLISEQAQALLAQKLDFYRPLLVGAFAGTLKQIDEGLTAVLSGKTTVLVGDRGCGKTSLVRSIFIALGESAAAPALSGTSASALYDAAGVRLVDTPGFRDFCLEAQDTGELAAIFPEIAEHAARCAFSSCTHTHEDGCAVAAAVQAGLISRERLGCYQKLSGRVVVAAKAKIDYRNNPCEESFACKNCGEMITPLGAGTRHRNHCPHCLCSVHLDVEPGDRASLCQGVMEPISVWVRKDGEWALIHKCRTCGSLSSNRIAADDNPLALLSIAVRPLSKPPFPLGDLEKLIKER